MPPTSRLLVNLAVSSLFLLVAILVSLLWLVQEALPPGVIRGVTVICLAGGASLLVAFWWLLVRYRSRAKREAAANEESEARFRVIYQGTPVGINLTDLYGHFQAANPAFCALLGFREEELLTRSFDHITYPEDLATDRALFQELLAGQRSSYSIQKRYVRRDGGCVWVRLTVAPVRDSQGVALYTVGVAEDITERRAAEQALKHQALHDALTDLPNRTLLRDRLEQAISGAHRDRSGLALLFLDLNRFKDVNDTFGHHVGDQLLQQIAGRLRHAIRESDTVARLGGDEFAILLPGTDEAGAIEVAHKIAAVMDDDFHVADHIFATRASVGIALYPNHGTDASALMRRADVAMYAAKRGEREHAVYLPEHDATDAERLVLTRELRSAIEHDQLTLQYQPQVNVRTGCADHVEALLRWYHPQRGLLPATTFVPLAEEHGLIKPLTLWVLREALRQVSIWEKHNLDIRVAVNLSPRTLHDPDLVEMVTNLVYAAGVKPGSLLLEITESAIIVDPDSALASLSRIHEMGIGVAIDDFGTGYSSLSSLQHLPVDQIKVDRSFVSDMVHNRDNAFIVRTIINLAHNLSIQVVAEGVEDRDTLDALTLLHCDIAQGYHFSHPLTASQFESWLARRTQHAASA